MSYAVAFIREKKEEPFKVFCFLFFNENNIECKYTPSSFHLTNCIGRSSFQNTQTLYSVPHREIFSLIYLRKQFFAIVNCDGQAYFC